MSTVCNWKVPFQLVEILISNLKEIKTMREKIEVSIFEPLEKEHTISIMVYEIPKVGETIKILAKEGIRVDYLFLVRNVIHLCSPQGNHVIALHCTRF